MEKNHSDRSKIYTRYTEEDLIRFNQQRIIWKDPDQGKNQILKGKDGSTKKKSKLAHQKILCNQDKECKKKDKNNKPQNHKWVFHPDTSKSCFIGGLSIKTTEKEFESFLKTKYSKFEILSFHLVMDKVKTNLSKGFGFINFKSSKALEKFLKLKVCYNGRKLSLRKAMKFDDPNPKNEPIMKCRVEFKWLPLEIKMERFQFLLEKNWEIIRCKLKNEQKMKKIVYVDFIRQKDAQECVEFGKFDLDGHTIKCSFAKIKKNKKNIERFDESKNSNNDSSFDGEIVWEKKYPVTQDLQAQNSRRYHPEWEWDDEGPDEKLQRRWKFLNPSLFEKINDSINNLRIRAVRILE